MSVAGSPVAEKETLGEQLALTGCSQDEIVQLPPGIEIVGCGVDTVSFVWRPRSASIWSHLEAPLRHGGLLQGFDPKTGELFASSEVIRRGDSSGLVKEGVGGGRVGYYPGTRMIYIEGRLAALLACDERASGLASPSQLETAVDLSARAVSQLLLPSSLVGEKCFLRRIDLACDVSFTEGNQGCRFMRALSALDLPRTKTDAWRKDGRIETIYYRTPSRGLVRLRIYDKGLEAKTHPPGHLLRLEHQWRFEKRNQREPSSMARDDLGSMWEGQLKTWQADNVVVADLNGTQRVIVNAVNKGTLSAFTAERLLGHLLLRGRGMTKEWWTAQDKPHLWSRRSRELRQLGLILDENGLGGSQEEAELPLGTVLRALRQAWPSPTPEAAC